MSGPAPAAGPSPGAGGAARPPPFRLPGEHFAAALVFLLAGAVGTVWLAPALAAGAFSDPRVAGVTHLLTLGWISTSILGALYQFLPVALGASIRWEGLAEVTFAAWTAGVAAFAGGMMTGRTWVAVAGAGAVGAAVILLLVNLGATLPRATRRGLTWWCVLGAAVFLAGAWLLGFLLAVNLGHDLLGGSRFVVVAVHLHIAAGGWVLLTMIGVADRLLPMFLLSHGAPSWPGRAAAAAVAAGALGLLLSDHVVGVWVLRPAGAALAAGTGLFLLQALLHYRARRRSLDPGMALVAGALLLLGAAAAAGWVATGRGTADPRLLTAYGLLLVPGGLGLFVAGHYYRIVPFLTWFHRFGPVAADRDVPRVGDLFASGPARAAGAMMTAGVGGGGGVPGGAPGGARGRRRRGGRRAPDRRRRLRGGDRDHGGPDGTDRDEEAGMSQHDGTGQEETSPDPDRVREALRQVIDPEVGLDVVTMGLVYGVEVDGGRVRIRHTLTTEGCPMGEVISAGIASAARRVPGVEEVETELVWEPRWHPGMMEEEAP